MMTETPKQIGHNDNGVHVESFPAEGGGINLSLTCEKCGKPITHSDKYGMRCEDDCMLEEQMAFDKQIDDVIDMLCPGLKEEDDE
jgi:hypothetical protein